MKLLDLIVAEAEVRKLAGGSKSRKILAIFYMMFT
jgi:hypothetical protein